MASDDDVMGIAHEICFKPNIVKSLKLLKNFTLYVKREYSLQYLKSLSYICTLAYIVRRFLSLCSVASGIPLTHMMIWNFENF